MKRSFDSVDDFHDFEEPDRALPEPRRVKRRILLAQDRAEDSILNALPGEFDVRRFQDVLKTVGKLYMKLHSFVEYYNKQENLAEIKNLRKKYFDKGEMLEPTKDNLEQLIAFYYEMNELIYDIGITKIGIPSGKAYEYGYDFLQGLSFQMNTTHANYRRLKENIRNMARMLKEDTDWMVVLTGTKRLGKSTLMTDLIQHANTVNNVPYGRDNLILNASDFWSATKDNPSYSTAGIDEMSRLLYSKDAMSSDQKKRKKKLKTYATRNIGLFGCLHNFYELDKEIINVDVKANIHLPSRGAFEFYSKAKINQFERADDGSVERPEPDFKGAFPDFNGELWKTYEQHEDEKFSNIEDGHSGGNEVLKLCEKVEDDLDTFTKEWGGNTIINTDLLQAEFGISKPKADQVKAKLESDHEDLGR